MSELSEVDYRLGGWQWRNLTGHLGLETQFINTGTESSCK